MALTLIYIKIESIEAVWFTSPQWHLDYFDFSIFWLLAYLMTNFQKTFVSTRLDIEQFEDPKRLIRSHKSKKDRHCSTKKNFIENKTSSNTNPTENANCTQFLLSVPHSWLKTEFVTREERKWPLAE